MNDSLFSVERRFVFALCCVLHNDDLISRLANNVEILKYVQPLENNDYFAIEKILLLSIMMLSSWLRFDFLVNEYVIFLDT